MRRQQNSKVGFLLAVIVFVAGVKPLSSQETQSNEWVARFKAGAAPIKINSQVKLTVDKGKLLVEPTKGTPSEIPLAGITAVSSSIKGRHPATDAEGKFLSSFLSDGGGACYPPEGCGAILLFTPVFMALSYPFKSTDHLVSIVWQDQGAEQEVVFSIPKSSYPLFIAELEKATGKTWKNLDAEWEKVQQELKREQVNKKLIRLDRKVRIAKFDLPPGDYEFVLLERGEKRGELYLFSGSQIDLERLDAVAFVEIATESGPNGTVQVSYREDNGITKISEMQILGKTLRFVDASQHSSR